MSITEAALSAQIDSQINTNGTESITGILLNGVLKQLLTFNYAKKNRVVPPAQVLTIEAGLEMAYATDFYNKGVVNIETAADNNFGVGMNVPQYGMLTVKGILYNEGLICNSGLIN